MSLAIALQLHLLLERMPLASFFSRYNEGCPLSVANSRRSLLCNQQPVLGFVNPFYTL